MLRRPLAASLLVVFLGCGGGQDASSPDAGSDAAADAEPAPPLPPAGLERWLVGAEADAAAAPQGGLLLLGGGPDVDAAFEWQRDRVGGGDLVVLRASGADGYNDYLYEDIGGVDSVETLLVDTAELASDPYVAWVIDHAEGIFLAGGDQAVYLEAWGGTPLSGALDAAIARGAVVGGTSAGCAVLGEIVFSAENGTVYSDEALADPYGTYMTLERRFIAAPALAGVVTDTHFAARDRMGRLLAFTARAIADGWAERPVGLGIDEATALVVAPGGEATVLGAGSVYAIVPEAPPSTCVAGEPLAWSDVPLFELRDGDTITLPGGATRVSPRVLGAAGGVLDPADPY